jgi:hypothetical protein
MKLSIHKKISSLSTILATGIVTLSALTPQAEAGVIWTFRQAGADVTAVVGGSFDVGIVQKFGSSGSAVGGSAVRAFSFDGALSIGISVGVATDVTSFTSSPNSGTGTFGHDGGDLYWDAALGSTLSAGTDVASGGTVPSLTWNNTTIDTIFGGGFFDNGPVTAWTLTGGAPTDTISYDVAAVPEPSSSLLVCLGAFGLLARRKR